MSLTILDIDEGTAESEAKVAEWEREFQARFTEPMVAAQRVVEWLSMTPEQIQQFMKEQPDEFTWVNRYVRDLSRSVKEG